MSKIGWKVLKKLGCLCSQETLQINGNKYIVRERLANGYERAISKYSINSNALISNPFSSLCSGFSVIDLVENSTTHKLYALKSINCHSIDDETIALREVENCNRLQSDYLYKIVDYELKGVADIVTDTTSTLYIVTHYYQLGSLAEHLQARSRKLDYMPEEQLIQMFLSICEGVRCIHEAKPVPLVHRDLKTANICLTNDYDPVIIDFGSMTEARLQICGQMDAQRLKDEAEERSSIVYRAPELFNVKSHCTIDERTDIWVNFKENNRNSWGD